MLLEFWLSAEGLSYFIRNEVMEQVCGFRGQIPNAR